MPSYPYKESALYVGLHEVPAPRRTVTLNSPEMAAKINAG